MRNPFFTGLAVTMLSVHPAFSAPPAHSANVTLQQSADDPAVQFIRKFYQDYFAAFLLDDIQQGEKKSDALKKQYCSPELLATLKEAELDYDIFINAQDANNNAASTLQIHPNEEPGHYVVYYSSGWSNEIVQINVTVKSTGSKWMITGIGEF